MKKFRSVVLILILGAVGYTAFYMVQKNSSIASSDQSMLGNYNNTLTELQKVIVRRFNEGNVPGIAEYFEDEVALSILGNEEFYDKNKATEVLSDFCQTHTPKKFFVKHHGVNQAGNAYYLIGELRTTSNEKFRVYISNNEKKIDAIEISVPTDSSI